MADQESPLGGKGERPWEEDDEHLWEEDHAGLLRSHTARLDARAGRLLERVPAVSFGALAMNDGEPGAGDPEWFPGVKLLARSPEEYGLLLDIGALLVRAAERAGIGRLLLRSPSGDTVDLIEANAPQDVRGAMETLDATPGGVTSGWTVPPEEVDGFKLTRAEAAVYGALHEMDVLFTPRCWVLHKGRRLYHVDFVIYHQDRAVAIEIDERGEGPSDQTSVRERFLRSRGLDVVHLGAGDIERDLQASMAAVRQALEL